MQAPLYNTSCENINSKVKKKSHHIRELYDPLSRIKKNKMLSVILLYLNQGRQWLHQLTFGELCPLLDPDIQCQVI